MSALNVLFRGSCRHRSASLYLNSSFRRNKYIVLIPEIPHDTPEDNSLLQTNGFPQFSEISNKKCINALGKTVIEFESEIYQLEESLEDESTAENLASVLEPLEKISSSLDFVWGNIKALYIVRNNKILTDIVHKFSSRILKAYLQKYQSLQIYKIFKKFNENKEDFSEPEKRLIEKHIREGFLYGTELSQLQLDNLKKTCSKLANHQENYRKNMEASINKFSHEISNPENVKELPHEVVKLMAKDNNLSSGPWTVTLRPHIYFPFMEYCGNRALRWNAWNASVSRASNIEEHLNNTLEIEFIRHLRQSVSNLLGFENFVEMTLQSKMAGSVENVTSMIATLHERSKETTEKELDDLQNFATQYGFNEKLELWDIPYWQRVQKNALYSVDDYACRQYFPLPTVLEGLFKICKNLFGITIKEASSEVDVWNKDVRFFKIYDTNDICVAHFYFDPYQREDKIYGSRIEFCRSRSDILNHQPLSYLIFNFPQPLSGKPSLLSFQDVTSVFQKFGRLLQHSLSVIPYSLISGCNYLELDVNQVCAHFMSHWLSDYETVAGISGHVTNGEPLPPEMHERLCKAQNYMAGYHLTKDLYFSALDMELYSRKTHCLTIMKEVWIKYMPFDLDDNDMHICSFPLIFCDDFAASYYSFKWSEMVAADLFLAFEEAGLNNEKKVAKLGKRFHDTFLKLSGGYHPRELFRRFRCRDPSPDALLKKLL